MGLLKTDYKNDVLDLAVNPDRKFQPVDNGDGTFSYNDVTTYSQVGDAFGANDINATNLAINNILGDCATVEETTTASKAYDIGDYLVMDGYFYKVTAAISAGNTLVVGGNIAQTNVGAEISSLNKDLSTYERFDIPAVTNFTKYAGYGYYSKATNTVRIYIAAQHTSPIETVKLAHNIPQQYRPLSNAQVAGVLNNTCCVWYVTTNGDVFQDRTGSIQYACVTGEYTLG